VSVKIPSLQEEKERFTAMEITQKPKEIWLDYCRKYAEENVKKYRHRLSSYTFTKRDKEDQSISPDLIHSIRLYATEGVDPLTLPDAEFSNLFESAANKLFIDYFFLKGETFIAVKSWQKVTFKLSDQER